MHALGEHVSAFAVGKACTDGKTAAQPLGKSGDVRLLGVLLSCQEGAGSAHAGLNLVSDHQNIPLCAEIVELIHILAVQGHDAALALDQLEHHGAHVVPGHRLHAV